MRRIFLHPSEFETSPIRIADEPFHHLVNVLRVRPNELIVLLDGLGRAVVAQITSIEKRHLLATALEPATVAPEPLVHITIGQAIGKGDKFEQVVQHATEIGASAFIPLSTERAVAKIATRDADEKVLRWTKIARGAAEQSGRSRIPEVGYPESLASLVRRFREWDSVWLLHPIDSALGLPLPGRVAERPRLLILVGPEGGFSEQEVEACLEGGSRLVGLGPYVLRTETAALVAVSQALFAWANSTR